MAALSSTDKLLLGAGAAAVLWLWNRGVAGAAADITRGAVDAAGGAVTGAVTGASDVLGIPTPADVSSDPAVARWIMDHPKGGYWEASFWVTPAALARGAWMDAGTGTPPPVGSKAYAAFPPAYTGGATGGW